jgi:hypothetical protein
MKYTILLIITSFIVISCEISTERKLVGVWHSDFFSDGTSIKYNTELRSDKTWYQTGKYSILGIFNDDYSAKGKWEVKGEYFIFTYEESCIKLIPSGTIITSKIMELTDDTLILLTDGTTEIYKKN